MKLKAIGKYTILFLSSLLVSGLIAEAATVTGTVTNKTTGKPSQGDTVVLVDVQAGMAEAARGTTDAHGHYSLQSATAGTALVRVDHQGGSYFIAAPQAGGSGDVTVYDVAVKVDGVAIDADMLLAEAAGGMIRVQERYLVRNTSLPPRSQFSANTFEFVLPANAVLDAAAVTRPGGLATNTRPVPLSQSGHFTFNVPIQPDQGEKETMFEVQYHMTYGGKFTFTPHLQMAADNLVVYLPKGMTFGGAKGADFQPAQEDPRVQTFVAKRITPGQNIAFTLSGEGQMPRDAQANSMNPEAGGSAGMGGGQPGGGLGAPIDTPDPLSSYKWWIVGGLALLFFVVAAILLRRQQGSPIPKPKEKEGPHFPVAVPAAVPTVEARGVYGAAPTFDRSSALGFIKDEMFALEQERIAGELSEVEYKEVRDALEVLLKRVLQGH
jgi:hypothetical protein